LLVTYHPETLSVVAPEKQVAQVLEALKAFPDATLIISGSNADSGGRAITEQLEPFACSRKNAVFRLSFGSLLYLSAMQAADVIVGNSSSGMIEAPPIGKATVNIGDRQAGRIRVPSIIDCPCESGAIITTIKKALSQQFRSHLAPSMVYGVPGEVAGKIAGKLCMLPVPAVPRKHFHDKVAS
jgi:UDP-N-acetylglucosamine 2-epimerase (non-hydrolysing)/GDP/UDP-N,N'-diacetylbacillosamine 2-epimerase (hydrolysing)